MIIHGKERNFLLTVGASAEIADLCPDGDIARMGEMMENASYSQNLKIIIRLAVAMNKGYEEDKEFNEAGYVPDILTERELLALKPSELATLQEEVVTAFAGDVKPTVEVEAEKKTK